MPLVPLIPRHQWAHPRCRCCGRLPVAPSRAPLARCWWLRPWHLARKTPRLCLFDVATCLRSVLLCARMRAAAVGAPMCWKSRLARSKLDSAFKENSAKCLATSLRIEFLKARMYARSSGCVRCEVPLHVAQFDVWRRVAHTCCGAQSSTRSQGISSASPGCVHVRVNRVDHVQESVLRDPVRRRVGHDLVRKEWSVRVHSVLFPSWTICVHARRRHWLIPPSWSTHARLLEPCAQL